MPATFSRIKDWVSEVLTPADLNAEIDNILENLGPAGIGSYAANLTQYQATTSPVTGTTPVLPTSLAGEIERLRYQIQAIIGADIDNWYDSPPVTLSGLSTIVLGNSVPLSRVESIDSDSYVNLLEADGTTTTLTLKGSTNTIVYYVNGTRYELSDDISISGMSTATGTGNTASYNDATLSGTHASTYAGEHETVMTLSSVGAAITAQAGVYQGYKAVHSGVTEYFAGYYNTTGTKIEKAQRGCFFLPDGSASSRVLLSNSDVITLQKLAWIFLKNDNTLTLTYNIPTYSFETPTAPAIGDYWFDMEATTWKTYGSFGFVASDAVLIGQAILSSTACVAARSVEPFRIYSDSNHLDIEVTTGGASLQAKNPQSSLSVYAYAQYWGTKASLWNAASLETPGSLAAAQTYYAYVKETSEFVLSTYAPNDRRGDLGGYYHPSHSWRCVGYATTSGSLFTSASLIAFSRSGGKTFYSNSVEDNSISMRTIPDGSITQVKRVPLGQQISADSGTQVTASGGDAQITNASVSITTTGRPVFIGLMPKNDTTLVSAIVLLASSATAVTGTVYFQRGGTTICSMAVSMNSDPTSGSTAKSISYPPGSFFYIDTPAAGTYTYTARVTGGGTCQFNVNYVRLVAYEL